MSLIIDIKMNVNYTERNKRYLGVVGVFLIIIAIVLFIIFLLRGQTVISGGWQGSEETQSITCESSNIDYPLFRDNNSTTKNTKIRAIFGNDNLKTISIVYTLFFDEPTQASRSEAQNHAEMADHFNEDKLGVDALGISYSINNDKLVTTMVASANQINDKTLKYFLLNYKNNLTQKDIEQSYINQGFTCVGDD